MTDKVNAKIGIEVHVPLATEQKLFCSCATNYWEVEEPNSSTCPVCTGMPGAKPYPLNARAVESAVMVAELLNCKIITDNVFVKRKHYDYPDLPSGYQRTSEPVGKDGKLGGVGIWEVHMEEDPGRYDLETGKVDYNRSGVALIEIVTGPDMKGPEEVRAFMRELLNILKYSERIVEVGGVMRADVNISIEGGAKVEIKNINSVKGAFKAIQYEILRQKQAMKRGAAVVQETRGFNEKSLITVSQRLKETADDYRYIPDPDIPPQRFTKEYVDAIELPETPQARRKRLESAFKIRSDYSKVLVADKDLADLYEQVAPKADAALAAAWMVREVLRQLNYRGIELKESRLSAKILVELLELLASKTVTDNVGKKLLERVIDSGESPAKLVKSEGLGKVSDSGELEKIIDEVLKEQPQAASDLKGGKAESLNFLMGQVMKKMKGRADQELAREIIEGKVK